GSLNLTTTQQAANSISGTAGTLSGINTSGTDRLTVNQNIDTAFHGAISNTVLVKNGSGHLYLSGSGDNGAGTLVVNEGLVSLAKSSTNGVHAAGGGTSLTINGGTARLGGNFTNVGASGNNTPPADTPTNYVDQIYYQATVALNAGTFDLNGRSESFNGLTGAAGEITNSATGSTSWLYTGQENASSSFGGSINDGTGTVGYVKLGTGTQTFTGNSSYTGETEVRAGTLSVQGALSGSNVEVKGGATLAGTGSLLGLTTEAFATVSPGVGAPGILTVTGSALLDGGTLSLQLNGLTAGTGYDQLSANSVSLASDVDLVLTLGFTPTPFVDSFVIVSNTGVTPVGGSGLFTYNGAPLANGDRFLVGQDEFQIIYNGGSGNDVILQAVPEPGTAALLLVGATLGFSRRRRRN
ncbi:MAG: PEP-CTERM sorting domain-containing protein, partial [Verrucomicrobiaceae bacterium]